jgi:hypothetical protein
MNETALPSRMEECFKSYFGIKQWLEENEIGFKFEAEGRP